MPDKSFSIVANFEKETKNAVRFEEEGADQIMGKVYIKKDDAAKLGNPKRITVKVSAS